MNTTEPSPTTTIGIQAGDIEHHNEWLYFLFSLLSLISLTIICIYHGLNTYYDLFTNERKSVQHHRHKPKLTFDYKLMAYLTMSCIFFYFATLIASLYQKSDSTREECLVVIEVLVFPWFLSKGTMYIIFLLRLHFVYGKTAYAYPKIFIYALTGFTAASSIILPSMCIYGVSTSFVLYEEDSFPNPCFVYFPYWLYVTLLCWDFIMNFLCLVLFLIPLRKALNAIPKSNRKVAAVRNIQYVGIKFFIMTSFCVITTIFASCLLIMGVMGYMLDLDRVVNSIGVILMTGYYPDRLYYERLCYPCLLCCPKGKKPDENVQRLGSSSTTPSRLSTTGRGSVAISTTRRSVAQTSPTSDIERPLSDDNDHEMETIPEKIDNKTEKSEKETETNTEFQE